MQTRHVISAFTLKQHLQCPFCNMVENVVAEDDVKLPAAKRQRFGEIVG